MAAGSYDDPDFQAASYEDVQSVLNPEEQLPRIMLFGLRRSGKTSIAKVIFDKLSPHETLFLDPSAEVRVKLAASNLLVRYQTLDFPGGYDFDRSAKIDPQRLFRHYPTIPNEKQVAAVFVIDAQDTDSFGEAIEYMARIVNTIYAVNRNASFDVFIHKFDGDQHTLEEQRGLARELGTQINEELGDAFRGVSIGYHNTSIYDHSIHQAFSKVVQRIVYKRATLDSLLESLTLRCDLTKTYLFDVINKIYIATNSSNYDAVYELCSDMIDVVSDVYNIYGPEQKSMERAAEDGNTCVIKLQSVNNDVLYYREVSPFLALMILMPKDRYSESGLIDYNVAIFKQGLEALMREVQREKERAKAAAS